MKFNDAMTGGALLALALAVLVNVAGFPAIPGQQVGPAVFPGLVALLLAGCGLILIAHGLKAAQTLAQSYAALVSGVLIGMSDALRSGGAEGSAAKPAAKSSSRK